MKKPSGKTSPEKENKKVNVNKGAEDYKVREDENNSIFKQANDKEKYPYISEADKQYKTQPEFIDRDSDSKDKS